MEFLDKRVNLLQITEMYLPASPNAVLRLFPHDKFRDIITRTAAATSLEVR